MFNRVAGIYFNNRIRISLMEHVKKYNDVK